MWGGLRLAKFVLACLGVRLDSNGWVFYFWLGSAEGGGGGGGKIMCWCQIRNLLISNPLCISVQLLVRDPNELLGSESLLLVSSQSICFILWWMALIDRKWISCLSTTGHNPWVNKCTRACEEKGNADYVAVKFQFKVTHLLSDHCPKGKKFFFKFTHRLWKVLLFSSAFWSL